MSTESSKTTNADFGPYHRVVVKAGTAVLTSGNSSLDVSMMARLVDQIAQLRRMGVEVLLVTSGAIAAGRDALGQPRERRDVPFRQVMAAVGQGRLLHTYQELFSTHDIIVAQALLTRADIDDRQGYLNVRDSLLGLLEAGVVPIINENDVVAVEEIGAEVFGDNDTLSALVSNLVDADLLVILTDTPGLYTADPSLHPEARLIPRVEKVDQAITDLAKEEERHPWSRGGMATKLEAARLATSWGVAVVIAGGAEKDILSDIVLGKESGTFFTPGASKMESRRRWLLSGLSTRGEIIVDDGASSALLVHNRSLLPAGVKEVRGDFNRHDAILIIDTQGKKIACGVTNYSSVEVTTIKGLHSDRIQEALGHRYGDEIVHRNNLALL